MDRSALSSVVFRPSSWQETPGSSAACGSSCSSRSLCLSRHSPGGSGTIWCLCHALFWSKVSPKRISNMWNINGRISWHPHVYVLLLSIPGIYNFVGGHSCCILFLMSWDWNGMWMLPQHVCSSFPSLIGTSTYNLGQSQNSTTQCITRLLPTLERRRLAPNLGCQQQENAKVRCATSKGNAAVVGATNLGIYKRGTSVQLTEQTYWTNAFCASLCAHLSRREKQQQTSSITNMNLEGSNLLSTHFTPKSYSKWEWIYLTRCLEEWTWGSQCDAAAAWKRIMLQPVV